jgi:hypothetical protein
MVAMLDYGFGEPAAAEAESAANGIPEELITEGLYGLIEGSSIV